MDLVSLDPRDYPGWDDLLLGNGGGSFFHSSNWANVLNRSYGYRPTYLSGIEEDRLILLMPIMEISSVLTGNRGISLPFTDHCDPIAPDNDSLHELVKAAIDHGSQAKWAYFEMRTTASLVHEGDSAEFYLTHDIELDHSEPTLFSSLGESNRRNIRKALRDGVSIVIDQTHDSLDAFYRLHCQTRRRHGLPPQPFVFFRNIRDHVLSKNRGMIITAHYAGDVIASAIFFHFGKKAILKYGASDGKFLGHRPNNLVLWEAIRCYQQQGYENLGLGRTEPDNLGLLRFKRLWGAKESMIRYYRFDLKKIERGRLLKKSKLLSELFARTPVGVLRLIGRLFYRHIG